MRQQTEPGILRKLPLWDSSLKIIRLKGGMTNRTYLVTHKNKQYVARFAPPSNKLLGLERRLEIHNYRASAAVGIGPNVVKYYPEYRLLIVQYIPGTQLNARTIHNKDTIKKIAHLLPRLHHSKRFKGALDPFKRTRKYLQVARKLGASIPKVMGRYLAILKRVEQIAARHRNLSPCHQDLVLENIIQTPSGEIKLIDWEFCGKADYEYDLAMLSVKGNFSEKEDKLLVKGYKGHNDVKLYRQIQMMKAVVYLAEAAYGIVQFKITKARLYKKYEQLNLKGFRHTVKALGLQLKSKTI